MNALLLIMQSFIQKNVNPQNVNRPCHVFNLTHSQVILRYKDNGGKIEPY
jgi:hypothetical protein